MTDLLQRLLQHPDPWARERAAMALDIVTLESSGGISESEAQELLLDLIRADQVEAQASSIETKTLLIQAVSLAAKLV
jgi:hypothetical protein